MFQIQLVQFWKLINVMLPELHAIIYVTVSQVGIQFTNTGRIVLQCSLLIFHERQ